jgi:hypothetical protein
MGQKEVYQSVKKLAFIRDRLRAAIGRGSNSKYGGSAQRTSITNRENGSI